MIFWRIKKKEKTYVDVPEFTASLAIKIDIKHKKKTGVNVIQPNAQKKL